MADDTKKEEQQATQGGGTTTMQVFQLIFTILSFLATIANLPLIVLAYKQLLKKA